MCRVDGVEAETCKRGSAETREETEGEGRDEDDDDTFGIEMSISAGTDDDLDGRFEARNAGADADFDAGTRPSRTKRFFSLTFSRNFAQPFMFIRLALFSGGGKTADEEEDARSTRRSRMAGGLEVGLGLGLRVGKRAGGWEIKVDVVVEIRRETTETDDGKPDDVTGVSAELSKDGGGREGVGGGGGGGGKTTTDDNGCGRERWAGQRHGRPLLEYWFVHVSSEATRIVAIESTSLAKFVGKEAGD